MYLLVKENIENMGLVAGFDLLPTKGGDYSPILYDEITVVTYVGEKQSIGVTYACGAGVRGIGNSKQGPEVVRMQSVHDDYVVSYGKGYYPMNRM